MLTRNLFFLILAFMLVMMPSQVAAEGEPNAILVAETAQGEGDVRAEAQEAPQAQSVEETESPETRARQAEEARQQRAKEGTESILEQKGGVLLPKGTLTLDPSLNYTHFSRNLIAISGFTLFEAIVIGRIQVEEIKRDILTGAISLRFGILDRLQVDAKVPYLYRNDRLVRPTGAGTSEEEKPVTLIDDYGLGDIEGGFSIHALRGRGWLPDVILNVKGKTRTGRDPYGLDTGKERGREVLKELPTGTGHYGLSGGLTLVKAIDPVVIFVTGNYFWNIKRDVDVNYGEIDPGDSIEYILGTAAALSERVSLSFSFQNIFTPSGKQNGVKIPNSNLNAASLFVGASYKVGKNVSLYCNVGVGLTEDSPDFQVQLNVPITFRLF